MNIEFQLPVYKRTYNLERLFNSFIEFILNRNEDHNFTFRVLLDSVPDEDIAPFLNDPKYDFIQFMRMEGLKGVSHSRRMLWESTPESTDIIHLLDDDMKFSEDTNYSFMIDLLMENSLTGGVIANYISSDQDKIEIFKNDFRNVLTKGDPAEDGPLRISKFPWMFGGLLFKKSATDIIQVPFDDNRIMSEDVYLIFKLLLYGYDVLFAMNCWTYHYSPRKLDGGFVGSLYDKYQHLFQGNRFNIKARKLAATYENNDEIYLIRTNSIGNFLSSEGVEIRRRNRQKLLSNLLDENIGGVSIEGT